MTEEKACRNCGMILSHGSVCPICGSKDLTNKWNSYVVILNFEKSAIAQKLNININSTFAIDVK
ncbi:MAG: DNA-directed RNA polymerase subunit E'' [Candidatus Marsarchaeota archaeon]|nr:DNA-directed RNA polymerase subunit E'' [Candidatus Marsarchaeota archaeon]